MANRDWPRCFGEPPRKHPRDGVIPDSMTGLAVCGSPPRQHGEGQIVAQ
jgi:hypothetical protein